MTSTEKALTSNNLKTVDSVVKNMAVGNKETEQKVAFVATVVDQKTTVIEEQIESKVGVPSLIDEDEEEKYFEDEDEEFCAEIENFVASQNELDERAQAVKMAESTVEADKEADTPKVVNVKEQVIDFDEEIDIKKPLDQEEITEEREKEKDENVDNEKKSDKSKEEEVVKNLADSLAATNTTPNTDATTEAADAAEVADADADADAGAGTETEANDDMHEDVSPTLVTAVKESPSATPSPLSPQPKKRSRQSNKSSGKETPSEKQKKSAKNSQKKKEPAKTEPTDAEIGDEEEEEEEEYEIEKIVGHRLYKGKVVKYEIKWKGYDEKDNTMEAANRMHDDVYELCRVYWDTHPEITRPSNAPPPAEDNNDGGDSSNEDEEENSTQPNMKSIKREEEDEVDLKRAHDSDEEMEEEAEEEQEEQEEEEEVEVEETVEEKQEPPRKKAKFDYTHVPPYMIEKGFAFSKSFPQANTNWTTAMKKFHAIQLSPIDKNIKLAFIEWKNGQRTIHHLKECHQKCPSALIQYYEERLRFV